MTSLSHSLLWYKKVSMELDIINFISIFGSYSHANRPSLSIGKTQSKANICGKLHLLGGYDGKK